MPQKRATCPECQNEYALRGLWGHLRFAHEYSLKDAKATVSRLEIRNGREGADRNRKVLDVLDRMQVIQERLAYLYEEEEEEGAEAEEARPMLLNNRFLSQEVFDSVVEQLTEEMNECVDELRDLCGLDARGLPRKQAMQEA